MIVVLKRGTTPEQRAEIDAALRSLGLEGRWLEAADKQVIHLTSGPTRRARRLLRMERVQALVPTSGPRVRREGRRFFPYHFLNVASAALIALGVLVLLAGYLPPGLGAAPDPEAPPPPLELPWYIGLPARALAPLPSLARGLALLAVLLVLFALPWFGARGRRAAKGTVSS